MIPATLGYGVLTRWGAALLFLALCCGALVKCGYTRGAEGLAEERAAHKATKQHYSDVLADLAEKTARAARLTEEASKAAAIERQANDKRYDDAQAQADKAERDLAAALRAGTERLQPWWGANCPGAAEGDAASAAGGQDAAADLRAASASRVVGIADRADRWIGWLQAELISTRKACEVTP